MQGALIGSYFRCVQSTLLSSTGTCPLLHRNAFRIKEKFTHSSLPDLRTAHHVCISTDRKRYRDKLRMSVVKIVLPSDKSEHQGGVDAALLKTVWF